MEKTFADWVREYEEQSGNVVRDFGDLWEAGEWIVANFPLDKQPTKK